ncbi:hypothetical protein BBK36DRAFT_1160852 [Trichoderma citrinoviride]|uniref:Uncharacterized protein n=1 Tax=Trichoderma citrinoviride TaxID=58853 RepID=A0A2T4B5W5_9HYPO|nr:hypothetical protein BBK36DRAFT_1160852 [Trichoderma citrinoviride]PTB64690.1 hypothetical protein BBK36DRAFT_1160852 [Trichoderma citrinoviride]
MTLFGGLGQRRGSKPRDLHIRKVSFSGCSLASTSDRSFSSDSSTSTIRGFTPRLATNSGTASSFDAFSIHSASQPPKRLHDRPFIPLNQHHYNSAPTFYDSEDTDSSDLEASERDFDGEDEDQTQFVMELPHASPVSHHDYEGDEPRDYFFMHINSRPALPRSRWSESTIASVESLDDLTPSTSMSEPASSSANADADQAEAAGESTPRTDTSNTVPKRPTFRTIDSFEDYVRRGGWKRRGVVFHRDDMDTF